LEEWERMKANLAKEELPVKRATMRDYAVVDSRPQADVLLEPGVAADAMASTADMIGAGGGRYPISSSSPAQGSTSARSRETPKGSVRVKELPMLAGIPVASSVAASRSCGMVAKQSPRRLVQPRFVEAASPELQEPPSPREAAKLQLFGEDVEGCKFDEEANLKITRVKANDLKKSAYAGDGRGRQAMPNKDRQQYGNGTQMRPAREMNRSSKKRLNDLLKLPTMRIEAGAKHSSRTYEIIPSQNLRVV
jgi:hypothetical protein